MQYAVPPNYVKPGSVKRTSSVRNATTVAQQQQQRQSGIIIPGMTISTPSPFVSTNNITRCESPIKQQTQTEAATTRTSERQLELLDLPDEIMTAIAMEAGFWGALALRGTCKQLFCLLDDKSSWHDYSRRRVKKITTTTMTDDTNTSNSTVYVQGPVDEIENTVTIETRLHTFDNLVFGTWRGSGCQSHDASALDAAFHKSQQESHHLNKTRTSTSPSYDIVMSEAVAMNNPAVFFEHKTFDERFDFLGGVQIRMNATGLASADFFDHRETLPCYLAYVDQLREAGKIKKKSE